MNGSVSEQYDPFRYSNTNQYDHLIDGDNYFNLNGFIAFNLYLPSKKQYILNKEWDEKINDFSQHLYQPFKKMVDQHYVLLKNVEEIKSCELSHGDIFDLKTNAIIIKENSDQIFKFEKLLSTFSMLYSEFNGDGFSGSVELSLKDCRKLFNIGQYFKI